FGDERPDDRVDRAKRVAAEDASRLVVANEPRRIVATDREDGLAQVVHAQREEPEVGRELVGGADGGRRLDHHADLVWDVGAKLGEGRVGRAADRLGDKANLSPIDDEWDLDLRLNRYALAARPNRRAQRRSDLHLGDGRLDDVQADAPVAEHRIRLGAG